MIHDSEREQRKRSILANEVRTAIDSLNRAAEEAAFEGGTIWHFILAAHLLRRALIAYVREASDPFTHLLASEYANCAALARDALERAIDPLHALPTAGELLDVPGQRTAEREQHPTPPPGSGWRITRVTSAD